MRRSTAKFPGGESQRATHGRGRGALLDTLKVVVNTGRQTPAPAARVGIARHLIIGYRPGWQSLSDLGTIAGHVRAIDPTIATFIMPTNRKNSVTRREAAARPTLVVSNSVIQTFTPLRGKVYQGSTFPKIDELRRLAAAGVPIPTSALLTPELKLDPGLWGEFVIVKPTDRATSSHGFGFTLMRTERVRYRAPADYPAGHPGRNAPMLVQQFIDTGDHLTICRVLTLFGEPLYAVVDRTIEPRVSLGATDEVLEAAPIASQSARGRESYFVHEERILSLARAAHAAIPEVPLKGCDIIQDIASGKLYVLELNCGGNTWHFSSAQQAKQRALNGREFELRRHMQFDAFRTAAGVLAAKTQTEAA